MNESLRIWWGQRTPREQVLLRVASGLIGLGVFVQMLFVSMDYRAEGLRRVESRTQTYSYIVQNLATNKPQGETDNRAKKRVSTVLAQTAVKHKLEIGRMQPGEAGRVNVSLSGVPAESFYNWLGELRDTHGIHVQRASVRREDKGIEVNLHLERTG